MAATQLRLSLADAPPSLMRTRNSTSGASYEAGAQTRRTYGWRAPATKSNDAILATLGTLRSRSRAAVRNDGYAKGAIERLVTNVIGTGIKPMSMAADLTFRAQLNALFLRWTDECDADGMLDFYGLQAQATRTWFEGGESFTRIRPRVVADGLSVPLQVQVLEPELCPYTHNVFTGPAKIRAGIEFNAIGRRVAYWFHPSRPEFDDYDASQLRRVPADSVCHMYELLRPGQLRGLPQLTPALVALFELDKYDDATLLRQQLSNLFVAFVRRPQVSGDAAALHPLTGEEPTTADDGGSMVAMEPGITQELAPGEEMQFSDPPATNGYPEFMRQQLSNISTATNVPYEVLTGDMRGVNDRTVRVILHEFRRRVAMWQHQNVVFQFCRPIWNAFMDRVFLSGALPIPMDYLDDPTPWTAVKWAPQGWPYLHPVQDVEANKAAVRAGFKSRSAVVSELGEDVEVIDAEQAADHSRADRLGLKYDSDGRSAGSNAAPVPPAPAPDDDSDDEPAPAPAQPPNSEEVPA